MAATRYCGVICWKMYEGWAGVGGITVPAALLRASVNLRIHYAEHLCNVNAMNWNNMACEDRAVQGVSKLTGLLPGVSQIKFFFPKREEIESFCQF